MQRYAPTSPVSEFVNEDVNSSDGDDDDTPEARAQCVFHGRSVDFDETPETTPRAVPIQKKIEVLVGEFTDHFKLLNLIHDAGPCSVIRVRCVEDGEEYVAKIQEKRRTRSGNDEIFRRMTVRMMNMAEHKHVVQIHACYEDNKYYYTLLEACEGGDLADFLKHHKYDEATKEEDVRQMMGELLLSLDHLHEQGFIHKDVKLENVMFKEKGETASLVRRASCELLTKEEKEEKPQPAPHGAVHGPSRVNPQPPSPQSPKENSWMSTKEKASGAKDTAQASSSSTSAAARPASGPKKPADTTASGPKKPAVLKLIDFDLTAERDAYRKEKHVVGTDGYIAPEAYLGKVCPKNDIFGAGVVMYGLMTKKLPFDDAIFDDEVNENWVGSSKMEEIHDKLRDAIGEVRFGEKWKDLDEAKEFCKVLLTVDVDKRPTASEALNHPWMAKFLEREASKRESKQEAKQAPASGGKLRRLLPPHLAKHLGKSFGKSFGKRRHTMQ
jgi:serine/threonine protein kinase